MKQNQSRKTVYSQDIQQYSMMFARQLKNSPRHKNFQHVKLEDLGAGISAAIKLALERDIFQLGVEVTDGAIADAIKENQKSKQNDKN